MSSADPQIVRWYTRARRFPQLIGRTPDGARIPGGPYTITQVATAGVLMLIALKTTSLWAHYGLIGNGLLLAGAVYGLIFLLGKIPLGSRSPLAVGAGAWRALSSPTTGRLGGRPVRLRRPHRVQNRMTVFLPAGVAAAPTLAAQLPPAAQEAPVTGQAEPVVQPVVEPVVDPVRTGAHRAKPDESSRRWIRRSRRTKPLSSLGHRRPAPSAAGETAAPTAPTAQQPNAAPAPKPAAAPAPPQPARSQSAPSIPVPAASAPALSGVQALLARNAASASASTSPTTSGSS